MIAGFMLYATGGVSTDETDEDQDCQLEEDLVNQGGLIKPSPSILLSTKMLEKVFREPDITVANLYSHLMSRSSEIKLTDEQKLRFFTTRINTRIRYLNSKIEEKNYRTQVREKFKKIL